MKGMKLPKDFELEIICNELDIYPFQTRVIGEFLFVELSEFDFFVLEEYLNVHKLR